MEYGNLAGHGGMPIMGGALGIVSTAPREPLLAQIEVGLSAADDLAVAVNILVADLVGSAPRPETLQGAAKVAGAVECVAGHASATRGRATEALDEIARLRSALGI
mgnify:CR=1 FL=1